MVSAQIGQMKRANANLSDQVTVFQAIALVFAAAFLIALIVVVIAVALRRRGFTQSFSGDVNGAIVIPFGHQP